MTIIIVGGGAAGFFAGVAAGEAGRGARVVMLEKGRGVLGKVKISGGGRCNVTHACFDPQRLVGNYPRGGRELLGSFHRFQPRDTVAWFEAHGVALRAEADGRMFPVSNTSQTIVDCLTQAAQQAGVEVRLGVAPTRVERRLEGGFQLFLSNGETLECERLLLATGGDRSGMRLAESLGHSLETPVPSLFTFTISDARLKGLAGLSMPEAEIRVDDLKQRGPLLITHWGLSGPVVLKLSSWAARVLQGLNYQTELTVNWLGITAQACQDRLLSQKKLFPRRHITQGPEWPMPQRLWEALLAASAIPLDRRWADLTKKESFGLLQQLTAGKFLMTGQSAFKEEFVTCGGVRLKEVNLTTMESRLVPGLYFAGELLDVDGLTGGFNFQHAWTSGWLAGRAMTVFEIGAAKRDNR